MSINFLSPRNEIDIHEKEIDIPRMRINNYIYGVNYWFTDFRGKLIF